MTMMEDYLLCAKHALTHIQTKLGELRARAAAPGQSERTSSTVLRLQATYLGHLERLRESIHYFLLQLANNEQLVGAGHELTSELASVSELPGLDDLEDAIATGRYDAVVQRVLARRAASLQAGVQALHQAAASLPSTVSVQPGALEAVVRFLSAREQSLAFHVRLAAEVDRRFGPRSPSAVEQHLAATTGHRTGGEISPSAVSALPTAAFRSAGPAGHPPAADALSYSVDNFAYGSTPYASWLKVLTSSACGDALLSAMTVSPDREYVVWGSSTGWLVLYGALTYGWRCRGVEILACLDEVAREAAEQQAAALAGTAGVRFICGDLLHDDVSSAGVVLLADQCWDSQLAAAAAAKLAAELPTSALCVSYTGTAIAGARKGGPSCPSGPAGGGREDEDADGESEVPSDGGAVADGGLAFEEVAVVKVPVSWTEEQPFRVFRKQ